MFVLGATGSGAGGSSAGASRAAGSRRARSGISRAKARKVVAALAAAGAAGLVISPALTGATVASASVSGSAAGTARAAAQVTSATADWPAYLDGPAHQSYSPVETAITPTTAASLVRLWSDKLHGGVLASPTVADGAVFVGTGSGEFFKLNAQTGKVMAKTFIGRQPAKTCVEEGVVSTATVATNPSTHQLTVYVAGGNGYLYALRASNLSREWRSVVAIPSTTISNFYNWASPTVTDKTIYMGVASSCDKPLVRAGVISYDQATGKKLAEFYTVPKDRTGGSVWSSVGVAANGDIFATTGNGPKQDPRLSYSESIIKLAPRTLKFLGRFQVPKAQVTSDGDFGSSPLLFGNYVGACNKNGIYYMLYQSTMKVAWEKRIGAASGTGHGSCLGTPALDGDDLFFGGNGTTIGTTSYSGSVEEVVLGSDGQPTAGVGWATGLAGEAFGSPSLDGGGILAVPVYGSETGDGVWLVDATTGAIVRQLAAGSDFAQATFAYGQIYSAAGDYVSGWGLKPAT